MKNREFREAAAKQTRGNILVLLMVYLIWMLLLSLVCIPTVLVEAVGGGMVALAGGSILFFLLSVILSPVMQYGMTENQNRMFRKEPATVRAGFAGIKEIGISVKTFFMTTLYLLLWFLIPVAGFYFVIERSYAYSCAFYIIQEGSNKGAIEAITESKRLIDGRKIRMFYLDVYYFFVWYLGLGIVTFGIAWIWGIPRHMQARYNLYQEAKKEDLLRVKGGIAS